MAWLPLAQAQPTAGSNAALITFVIYTLIIFTLAIISSRVQRGRSFLSEYFLGSRGLGMWTFALTFAATSASGGSFTGFPSLIYSHGWVLALWIASYMLVPALMMGLLGKRMNQMGRRANAITVPDVLGARFNSRRIATLATVLIIFFLTFNLVAQFKAGAVMLSTLLDDVPLFQVLSLQTGGLLAGRPLVGTVEPGYLICLVFFAMAVIIYTSYGGFRAVVWTDVAQGIVMVFGVLILLPLTLWQVGGLRNATQDIAQMTPPRMRRATIHRADGGTSAMVIPFGTWIEIPGEGSSARRVFRTGSRAEVLEGEQAARYLNKEGEVDYDIPVLEITSPHEVERIGVPPSDIRIVAITGTDDYASGADQVGVYVNPPGPSVVDSAGFLPLGLAISFFFFWTFSGSGQPSNMVRLMSFNSSLTLRRAMMMVAIYFSLIYFPLVLIFCCARVLLPGMEIESDRIMPAMAEHVTRSAGWPWLAGLLVAAPFAAVMSTVDSFLLIISSAIVRDVYQRDIHPEASERTLRRLTYTVTVLVGIAALVGAVNPPQYLQNIIVFTTGGLSACFLTPVALALYWPRFNTAGAVTSMSAGFCMHVVLYVAGYWTYDTFKPLKVAGFDPLLPELLVSFVAAIVVALSTAPPKASLTRRFFGPGRAQVQD